jgi:hypothetical protein
MFQGKIYQSLKTTVSPTISPPLERLLTRYHALQGKTKTPPPA